MPEIDFNVFTLLAQLQPSKSGNLLDGKALSSLSQYFLAIVTTNFLIMYNDVTNQTQL